MSRMTCLLPLLLVACSTHTRLLKDGERAPAERATLIGHYEFDGFGVQPEFAFLNDRGHSVVIYPRTKVFAYEIEPGEYRMDYIYMYRMDKKDDRRFRVAAGEAVYMGSWIAVLGPGIDLRDELETLRPEIERRFGKLDIRTELPGRPGVFWVEVDPSLNPLEVIGD